MRAWRAPLVLTAAAAVALSLGAGADASARRGARTERIHLRSELAPAGSASTRFVRLDVSRRNLQNQAIRLQVTNAPAAEALLVFVADASGVMRPVGSLSTKGRSGRAAWNVRTARGDALPFGVPDVAFLSGRAIEVRTDSGVTLLEGVLPSAAKATGISRRMKSLKQGLAVDPAAVGVEARVEFRRGEHGLADRFSIHVEGGPTGLALEAWLQGADGTFVKLGDLVEESDEGDDEADDDDLDEHDGDDGDDGDDDGTSDRDDVDAKSASSRSDDADEDEDEDADEDEDEDDDGDSDTEYEFDLDAAAALPFGVTSLAELAGLRLEIRVAADQSVLASGILPDTSAPGHEPDDDNGDHDDDDDDGDEDDHDEVELDRA